MALYPCNEDGFPLTLLRTMAIGKINETNTRNVLGKPEALVNGVWYVIGNPTLIPFGEIMGLFKYDPEDQFAYYIPLEKVEIKA